MNSYPHPKFPPLPLLVLAIGLLAFPGGGLALRAADTPESLAAERAELQKLFPEAFAPVVDNHALPRVLLIGDSISIGYTVPVRELLKGIANVHRIPVNGGPTTRGLMQLDSWLGSGRWDVIHFNFGLHDILRVKGNPVQVPIADYEKNLRTLVTRLRATGAKLVFATMTPVPGRTSTRQDEDAVAYNAVAQRVMLEFGVPVDDLYGFARPRLADIQRPANVHFTPAGSRELAGPVAAAIRTALAKKL